MSVFFLVASPAQAKPLAIRSSSPFPYVSPRVLIANQSATIQVSFDLGARQGYIPLDASEELQRQREEEINKQWSEAIVTAWLTDDDKRKIADLGELLPQQPELPFLRRGTFTLTPTIPGFVGIQVAFSVPDTEPGRITSDVTFLEVVSSGHSIAPENNPNAPVVDEIIDDSLTIPPTIRVRYRLDAIWITFDETVPHYRPLREVRLQEILAFLDGKLIGRNDQLAYEIGIEPVNSLSAIDTKIAALTTRFPYLLVTRVEQDREYSEPEHIPRTIQTKLSCLARELVSPTVLLGIAITVLGLLFIFRRNKLVTLLFGIIVLIAVGFAVQQAILFIIYWSKLYPERIGQIIIDYLPAVLLIVPFLLMLFGKRYTDRLRGKNLRFIPLVFMILGVITFIAVFLLFPITVVVKNCIAPPRYL